MIDKDDLCQKIRDIYPDIGECGIDIAVAFDETNQRWVVDLKKGSRRMKTFLEEGDAEAKRFPAGLRLRSAAWLIPWKISTTLNGLKL